MGLFSKLILENERSGIHIRDTYIDFDKLKTSPNKEEIEKLIKEFGELGYVDVRTEMGPDQWARMSKGQKEKMDDTRHKAWDIESKIKHLLKSKEETDKENSAEETKKLKDKLLQLTRRNESIDGLGRMSHLENGKLKPKWLREYDENKKEIESLKSQIKE